MALYLPPHRDRHVGEPPHDSRYKIAPNTGSYYLPSAQLSALFQTLTIQSESLPAPPDLAKVYHTEVIPRLRSILPEAEIPQTDLVTTSQCSNMHLRLLIYAVTNNLAGLHNWTGRASASVFILEYLERLSADLLRAYKDSWMRQALFRDFPSMRPLTETLFKAAVAVGNLAVARQILFWPESGVNVNKAVILGEHNSAQFTALEFAAQRQDLPLVMLLVEHGADLQGTH